MAAGSAAMVCVGGSVAVSSVLAGAQVYTAEGVRYGVACFILVALSRLTVARGDTLILATDGVDVPVEAIAQRAGVGLQTVIRRVARK